MNDQETKHNGNHKVKYASDEGSPKVLWVGDAAVNSGFASCTHAVCGYLRHQGWSVNVLGLNYFGDPHNLPYPIYPCRHPVDKAMDGFGAQRLPHLIDRLRPDVVVFQNDPWNVKAYTDNIREYFEHQDSVGDYLLPSTVGWLAVDGFNQPGDQLYGLDHVVTWSESAMSELVETGCGISASNRTIIPLGVDLNLFYPRDKAVSRQYMNPILKDKFVVAVVCRNQTRKRIDLSIRYFADWISAHSVDDAVLLLHVSPTGPGAGEVDMLRLAKFYNVADRVVISNLDMFNGIPYGLMPFLYSGVDVLLSTAQGEGWALPVLEAMACGTPTITPQWPFTDWIGGASLRVPCPTSSINAPLNSKAYTVGYIPDQQATVEALNAIYTNPDLRLDYSQRGLDRAKEFPWLNTCAAFDTLLRRVVHDRRLSILSDDDGQDDG